MFLKNILDAVVTPFVFSFCGNRYLPTNGGNNVCRGVYGTETIPLALYRKRTNL